MLPLILPGTEDFVFSMALSPNEPLLAFGSGRNILLWNLQTGVQQHAFFGHSADVLALAFSPDGGQLVSGSGNIPIYGDPVGEENAVRLWDVDAQTSSIALPGYSNIAEHVAFSPDGSAVAAWGYFESTVGVWSIPNGEHHFFKS